LRSASAKSTTRNLPDGMREFFGYRDARLLFVGQTLSAFGDWALLIVLAVWTKTLTGSSAAAGLTFFAFALGTLAAPLGGLLADRVKRRPLMIATDCVLGVTVLVLLFLDRKSEVWLVYVVALVYGLGGTVFYPARSALLRVMLPEDVLGDANGLLSLSREGLRVIAPLVGAGIYSAFGGGVVAVLDSATFAASAICLALMRVREEKPEPPEHHFWHEVTLGVKHIWNTVALRQVVIGTTVAFLVVGFSETLIFSVIGDELHRKPSFFGVLAALQGAGAIVGGLTAGTVMKKIGDTHVVGLGLALFAAAVALLLVPRLPVVLVGFALAGVGIVYLIVGFTTAIQLRTPLAIQGRASAAADLALSLAQTVSIATGAALSTLVDYRVLLAVMAAVTAIAGAYILSRRALSAPVEEPEPA
jgi:MFS family permease